MRHGSVGTTTPEQQQRAASKAWGPWLYELGWSHTFDGTIDPRGDHRAKPESVIRGEWNRFHRRLEGMTGTHVRFAWVFEENDAGRHVHALIADCESLTVRLVRDAWKAGLATAHCYDAERGAAFYDTKYVGRANGSESVETSDELPPRLHSAPDNIQCASDESDEAAMLELVTNGAQLDDERRAVRPVPVTVVRSLDVIAPDAWEQWGAHMARIILRRDGRAA